MNFSYEINTLHGVVIFLFILVYLLLTYRYVVISRFLKVNYGRFIFKFFLRLVYLFLFLIVSLGPHIPEASSVAEVDDVGKDIFFALDLSKSMNVEDVAPSRIERAKHELMKIARAFSTDRLGLIIFSDNAYLQCPLTFDKAAFQLYLETTSTDLVPGGGTDFSKALNMALTKQTVNEAVENKAKIIVLVSDGEDFGEETIDAAKEIKKEGIKLFTLGIGTNEGGKISAGKGFVTSEGKEVVSALNAKALKKLAKITGGEYYEISRQKNQIEQVIGEIKKIKGTTRDKVKMDAPKNSQYEYFLIPALLLLLLDFIWTLKLVRI